METSTIILSLLGVLVIGVIVLVIVKVLTYHRKINANVPEDMITNLKEAERRYKERIENGEIITGEQILYELGSNPQPIAGGTEERPSLYSSGSIPARDEGRDELQDANSRFDSNYQGKSEYSNERSAKIKTRNKPVRRKFKRIE